MHDFSPGTIILAFSVVVIALSSILLVLNRIASFLINRSGLVSRKNERQFECGLNPSGGPVGRLSVSYFLIAAAFLIFELEGAVLLPWAVDYWRLGLEGVFTAVLFMVILLLGLIYMLAKGGLKYE